MFNDDFHAWPSGPVIPEIYDDFVQYQTGDMLPIDEANHSNLTSEMEAVLDEIFDKTITISALTLVKASHIPGGPWEQVYEEDDEKHKQIISKSSMYEFYTGMSLDEILTPKVD